MGILNWVQGKLSGRGEKKRFEVGSTLTLGGRTSASNDRKEEFSDWPQALLAIGTFGNSTEIKAADTQRNDAGQSSHPSQDSPDFTIEVAKLHEELTKLLALKPQVISSDGLGGGGAHLPLNRFLNCPSSLEVDRRACIKYFCDDLDNNVDNGGDPSPDTNIILNKAKDDILADNRNVIKQRSISFLLKKMLMCPTGFAPAPCLRDPIPESRMEKLLRILLHKKIYPQNSASVVKKYLEKKPTERKQESSEIEKKEEDGHKWVKTDSEYIVLEI